MIVQSLHVLVIQGVQNIGANINFALEPEEIGLVLNMAQNSFIREQFNPDQKLGDEKFDLDFVRNSDLRNLLIPDFNLEPILAPTGVNYVDFALPPKTIDEKLPIIEAIEYPIVFSAKTKISATATEEGPYPVRVVKSELIHKVLGNPFSTTHKKSPVAVLYSDFIRVYFSKRFIVEAMFCTYLKKPHNLSELSLNTEIGDFSDPVYEVIARKAVQHILEAYQSPRYQSNAIENELNK